jgi:hypothetical protein
MLNKDINLCRIEKGKFLTSKIDHICFIKFNNIIIQRNIQIYIYRDYEYFCKMLLICYIKSSELQHIHVLF